jgi:hypothetical protein
MCKEKKKGKDRVICVLILQFHLAPAPVEPAKTCKCSAVSRKPVLEFPGWTGSLENTVLSCVAPIISITMPSGGGSFVVIESTAALTRFSSQSSYIYQSEFCFSAGPWNDCELSETGFFPLRPALVPRSVHVGFVMEELGKGKSVFKYWSEFQNCSILRYRRQIWCVIHIHHRENLKFRKYSHVIDWI